MNFYLGILSYAGIYGMLAMSFTLVHGTAGMFTIAHAAFFGLGAYASAMLDKLLPPELMVLGMAFGTLFAATCAAAVAAIALRERGQYLMLVTFSVQIIFSVALLNLSFTGGDNGIGEVTPLQLGPWRVKGQIAAAVVVWALAGGMFVLLRYIERSNLGRALRAIREDEHAVEALGADVFSAKLFAFVASAALAGFAGAVFAHYSSYINPASFSFEAAILIVTMSVLGGQYSLSGALVGGVIVVWLPQLIGFIGIPSEKVAAVTQLIYAVIIIAVLFLRPSGIVGESIRRFAMPPAPPKLRSAP
ncbi:MAG: branched-chain amino acid ABC transporter permease [Rhodospirillales bacterium]